MTEYTDVNGRRFQWFGSEAFTSENSRLFCDVTAENAPLLAVYIREAEVVAFKVTRELWFYYLNKELVTFDKIEDDPPNFRYRFGRLILPP